MDPSFWQIPSRPVAPGNLNCNAGRYLTRFSADPHELGRARPLTALFSVIKAHLSRRLSPDEWPSNASRWRRHRLRPQFRDEPQNFPEQVTGYRNLGHLERDIASVADDPGSDVHELFPQRGQ